MHRVKIVRLSLIFSIAIITATIFYSCFDTKQSVKNSNASTHEDTSNIGIKNCIAKSDGYKALADLDTQAKEKSKKDNEEISQKERDEFFHNGLESITKSPLFARIEKQAVINNECGAISLRFLETIYEKLGDKHKAESVHQNIVGFAEKANSNAITTLCYQEDDTAEELKYCKVIMNDNQRIFSKETKEYAVHRLSCYFTKIVDADALSELCDKTNSSICYNYLKFLSNELYNQKKFTSAEKYYKQLIKYYENVLIKNNFTETKEHNYVKPDLYDLVDLYNKTHRTSDLIKLCTTNSDLKEWEKIGCTRDLGYLANDYFYQQKNYDSAFKIYMAVSEVDVDDNIPFKKSALPMIAWMYSEGKGVKKDEYKALEWYYRALRTSNNKYTRANIHGSIGLLLHSKNDIVGAFNNIKKSAELGNSWNQVRLAIMYYHGHGVIQDYGESYAWASVALAIGIDDEKYKNLAEEVKKDSRHAIIYNAQPGVTLQIANDLAKQHYNNSANDVEH